MSQLLLETTLKTLDRSGTLIKDRGYRQVWRFEHDGKPYFLKFYPRAGSRLNAKRLFRGSPAMREFTRLQWLQKASIPAPRATAVLMGFNLRGQRGDAVILEAIEPSVALDTYLNSLALDGRQALRHREIAQQVREIVRMLGKAKLGHSDLHLGNFLVTGAETDSPKLYLLDAYAVRAGGMRMRDVLLLGNSARRFATRTDILRTWRYLELRGKPPHENRVGRALHRKFLSRTTNENRYFGRIRGSDGAGWSGVFFKHAAVPRRWSRISTLDISSDDWKHTWPDLLANLNADQLDIIKRSRSGDVLATDINLGGRPLAVIVKRPRWKHWWRPLTQLGRGARPRRAWRKAWRLIERDIPTAWPLLLMERKVLGYVVDSVIVYERVRGELLNTINFDELTERDRTTLFARVGQLMRKLVDANLWQSDAKSVNWMIVRDNIAGPAPIVIDVDGVRHQIGNPDGMARLLRSMQDHPQYTPADSLVLCRGFAPFATFVRDELIEEATTEELPAEERSA